MNRNVDYSARPSYEDYILGLDGVDLRFLLSRTCPAADSTAAGQEAVALLTSEESARMALSFADPDVLDVAQLVHVFEDSTTVDVLAEVAYWASDMDTAAHDTPEGVDRKRRAVGKRELESLLRRGQRQGVVWEQPEGVWNVPAHISAIFPAEPTLDFYVRDFARALDPGLLKRRMERLGLTDADEDSDLTDAERQEVTLKALRDYLCDPVKVRAVVATAPVDIRNQLRWLASDEKQIAENEWSSLRDDAIRWAEERLLVALVPNELAASLPEEIADSLPGHFLRFVAPAALALKKSAWFIRRQHRTEPYPSTLDHKELTEASVAAVAFASAFMDAVGSDDGRLKDPLDLYDQVSLFWIQDFAASIGADAFAAPWIVEMLVNAGLVEPRSGQPTSRALEHWYNADASTRWAYLAAGFLAGRGPWRGEFPWVSPDADEFAHATVAYGYPMAAREVVSLAAQLEEDQKFYGCCVDNTLAWHTENLCLRNGADTDSMVSWLLEQAGILGILFQGHSSWQAMAIMYALHDLWLSDQHVGTQRMAELIAEFAAGQVPTAEAVQISRLVEDSVPNERLTASLEGVASNAVAMALDFIGAREKCGASSRWIISEESLRWACLAVDGDVDALFSQLGPLLNSSMKLVIYAELVRITKTEKLNEIFECEPAQPTADSPLADAPNAPAFPDNPGEGPDDPDEPEQLSLF